MAGDEDSLYLRIVAKDEQTEPLQMDRALVHREPINLPVLCSLQRVSREAAAFTLLEILAVVGVLVLLAALLVPAGSSALERSRSSKCTSNMRKIFSAMQAFAADNDGRIVSGDSGFPVWSDALVSYLGMDPHAYGPSGARPTGVFACPSSKALCGGGERSDYSMNTFVNGEIPAPTGDGRYRFSALANPSETIAFVDGVNGTSCVRTVAPWINPVWGIAFRHGEVTLQKGYANVMFFDGHGEARKQTDLSLASNAEQKLPWNPAAVD